MHDSAFIRSLDETLGDMHVHREAYYGGTFTGNSAHKCLKVMDLTVSYTTCTYLIYIKLT